MKITTFLEKGAIIEELKAATKEAALEELASVLPHAGRNGDREEIVRILMAREKLGSTGIGDGIAIPHGKIRGLDRLKIAFGRSKRGVDFNAMDGKPVYLFFLLMAPEDAAGQHLKILAKISRLLKDEVVRKKLREAKSPAEIYQIILEKDQDI